MYQTSNDEIVKLYGWWRLGIRSILYLITPTYTYYFGNIKLLTKLSEMAACGKLSNIIIDDYDFDTTQHIHSTYEKEN